MTKPKVAVIRFPGSNDDRDAQWALKALGADAQLVWHAEDELPHGTGAVVLLAPVSEPDTRAGGARGPIVALGMAGGFGVLAWLVTQTDWLPAGGSRQQSMEWLGSRFLTDHLLTLELCAALLCLSALGTVALLRGRRAGR